MWVDLPDITHEEIVNELNKPLSQEVLSIWECRKDVEELLAQSKAEVEWLKWEIKYSDRDITLLREIYCELPPKPKEEDLDPESPEEILRKSIENQKIQIFEVPWENLVALSVNWKNVDSLYNLDWEIYIDFLDLKNSALWSWYYMAWERLGYNIKINEESGIDTFTNISTNKTESILSEEVININYKIAELLKSIWREIVDEIDRLEKEREQ